MMGVRSVNEFYGCYYHGCPICVTDQSKVVRRKHHENGFHTVEDSDQYMAWRLQLQELIE